MDTMISVKNLVNRFGKQVVHDGLSMDVRRDEIMGVVGGSGSGKSVLMRSILGLQKPTGGSIEVMGQTIEYHEPGPSRCWGVLFQGGALLSGLTVQENVELPIALHSDMPVETRHELASLKLLMALQTRRSDGTERSISVLERNFCTGPPRMHAVGGHLLRDIFRSAPAVPFLPRQRYKFCSTLYFFGPFGEKPTC